jgi:hypothetical protein
MSAIALPPLLRLALWHQLIQSMDMDMGLVRLPGSPRINVVVDQLVAREDHRFPKASRRRGLQQDLKCHKSAEVCEVMPYVSITVSPGCNHGPGPKDFDTYTWVTPMVEEQCCCKNEVLAIS